ncbi:MFS transporter [Pimelobacter simplex]|uniref:MFS transporter n=1 Tax=Nocardioides simplex TaxID=2045 RepID=UPI0021502026|nr:MFS transporter [Pimelobacter simplex]UUW88971.1 MFS transporter [Pimelobacter simplex]UUW98476.1 MFS transporter [Pimelobacter simplex]
MSGVTDAGSTRLLLAGPAVARTFACALLGRLAYGVLPLCFLFTVRDATGSLALAASASALLGLATLAMPVHARLIDRLGQQRVLPVAAACWSACLVAGVVLAQGEHPSAAWLALAFLTGLSGPVLGPSMRAQWREIAPEGPQRRRAYALDAIGEESLYLVGPIVAGLVLATGPAWAGLLVAATLVWCGTLGLVGSPYRPAVGGTGAAHERSRGGPASALGGLVAALALFGAGSAAVFVGIAALADRAGRPGLAGLVEAALAVGAVTGGLLWARHGRNRPAGGVLALLLVVLALAQGVVALAGGLLVAALVLAVGGLATSPVFVVAYAAVDERVPAARRTEMSTWVNVGVNGGSALGTALAGLVAGGGAALPFALAAGLSAGAAGVAVAWGRMSGTVHAEEAS